MATATRAKKLAKRADKKTKAERTKRVEKERALDQVTRAVELFCKEGEARKCLSVFVVCAKLDAIRKVAHEHGIELSEGEASAVMTVMGMNRKIYDETDITQGVKERAVLDWVDDKLNDDGSMTLGVVRGKNEDRVELTLTNESPDYWQWLAELATQAQQFAEETERIDED